MRVVYKYFRGTLKTWDDLFDEAAKFATEIGEERLITISHSCDSSNGIITIWYWSE